MSLLTPELALVKAEDPDDTADYLTGVTGLAGSLNILDGLFNSTTGHNHNGAHQGGNLVFGVLNTTSIQFANGATLGPFSTGNQLRFQSTNVSFSGAVTIDGALNTTGGITGPVTATTLNVSGTTTLGTVNTGALTTSGLQVNGNSTVTGTASSGAISSGTITASGRITANADFVIGPTTATEYFGADGAVSIQRTGAIGASPHPLIVTNSDGLWIRDYSGLTFYTPTDPQPTGNQQLRVIKPSTRNATTYGGGEVQVSLRLNVDGDIWSGSYVHGISFIQTSDPEAKQNMVGMSDADCMLRVRNPGMVVYTYEVVPTVPPGEIAPTTTDIGFSAAEVNAVAPEFAALNAGTPVGVNYANMSALLWGALRSLDARVQALEVP